MKHKNWIRHIHRATASTHLREAFNSLYHLLHDPFYKSLFFTKIKYLQVNATNNIDLYDLEELKDDIELEIEFGAKLKALRIKEGKEPAPSEAVIDQLSEAPILTSFINDLNFRSETDLLFKVEKETILRVLAQVNGNRTATSKILGLSIRALRNKLNFYNSCSEIPSHIISKESVGGTIENLQ